MQVGEAFHPSVVIQDELDARGWSRSTLANHMPGDPRLNLLELDMYFEVGPTAPNMRIGTATAFALGTAFEVNPRLFLNLETAWLAAVVQGEADGG